MHAPRDHEDHRNSLDGREVSVLRSSAMRMMHENARKHQATTFETPAHDEQEGIRKSICHLRFAAALRPSRFPVLEQSGAGAGPAEQAGESQRAPTTGQAQIGVWSWDARGGQGC